MNLTYGAQANSREVTVLLQHVWQRAFSGKETYRPTPVCIWGGHGIGKTQIVRELAQEMGVAFRYFSPAQFEEMGDLIGMPSIIEGQSTRFMPPEWVPRQEGPGILLIDDINRADDRILRGLMQLLQFYETASWALPPKWHIVLTANPDGGDYSVTPMDEAMLTRMLHVTLVWDLQAWLDWADRSGVDPRGIAFVKAHPEYIDQHRTTPRTLVQFFQEIQDIGDLQADLPLLQLLASGTLAPEAVAGFISFVRTELALLWSAEELLGTDPFSAVESHLAQWLEGEVQRIDLLSTQLYQLIVFLKRPAGTWPAQTIPNLRKLLMLPLIPDDLRFSFAQQLAGLDAKSLQTLLAEPEIGKLLLSSL